MFKPILVVHLTALLSPEASQVFQVNGVFLDHDGEKFTLRAGSYDVFSSERITLSIQGLADLLNRQDLADIASAKERAPLHSGFSSLLDYLLRDREDGIGDLPIYITSNSPLAIARSLVGLRAVDAGSTLYVYDSLDNSDPKVMQANVEKVQQIANECRCPIIGVMEALCTSILISSKVNMKDYNSFDIKVPTLKVSTSAGLVSFPQKEAPNLQSVK